MSVKIGFLINPVAGMGGRVGLKGTDGVFDKAVQMGARPVARQKAEEMLREFFVFSKNYHDLLWITCSGELPVMS